MFQLSKWKTLTILGLIGAVLLFALPNVLPQTVRDKLSSLYLPYRTIVLGLDLQGGAHLVFEVDKAELTRNLVKQMRGEITGKLFTENKIKHRVSNAPDGSLIVRLNDPSQIDKAVSELRELSQPVNTGFFNQGADVPEYAVEQQGESSIVFKLSDAGLNARIQRAIQQSIEIVSARINDLGTTEPVVQQQGAERVLVQAPGLKDPQLLIDLIGQTANLTFQLLCETQRTSDDQRVPIGCEELKEHNPINPQSPQNYWVQTAKKATVSGEDLTDAQPSFDQRNEPIVTFRFNQKGALLFGKLTQANVNRPFAIVLDSKVVSAPVIREPILGGSGQISGNFTTEESNSLAIVLRSGALPAKLVVVERRTVGPSLGSDSIRAGFIACVIGLVAVLIFMMISYGTFGIFANISLVTNLLMLLGILSALQATLTLPGIAGIVLTLGMAVDSNVLVFERIREEIRNGRTPLNAIETGFSRAFGTILDANITTFIAAVVLFGLGSGPIRGFAVTLGIGILTTVFTAFTLTRLVVAVWVRRTRPKTVPI